MSGAGIVAERFGWRHASRKRLALQEVSFEIAPGEKVLLLGESGAGKSTLLSAIAGVLGGGDEGDFHGSLTVAGVDVRDTGRMRGTVGMLLQDPDSQVIASRIGDDVAFGCENLGLEREETWRRVREALDMVGLELPLDHPTAELSGGQKQRLALAGVIAMGARVILLDEPTANLDPVGVQEVQEAVARVARESGATVVVVEHRVRTWQDLCTRGLVIGSDGAVLYDAPLPELLASHAADLAARGIWVPEELLPKEQRLDPVMRPLSHVQVALTAEQLVTGWNKPVGEPRTLSLPQGRSTVITGPNGAGKSTLALTLAGLLPPLGGRVQVAGYDSSPHQWSSTQLAGRIGFVFQDPEHQFLCATVAEEMLLASRVRAAGRRWGRLPEASDTFKDRAAEILDRLGLTALAQANPFTLSGGQKRRLSVATALVTSPSLLFLDEPTFGQDRRTFAHLVTLLRELCDSGVTVASITHDDLYQQLMGDHCIKVRR